MDSRYSEKQIQELRKQLIAEGFDERLVRLVGTVPLRKDDYKEEIRDVIYERYETMTATKATAEVFWTAFRALPKKEREAVVKRLLGDKEFVEDLIDIVILEQRQNEPSISLDEYLAHRGQKGT
jgi:hypothetical protein